jgi:hypothetical protein
MLLVIAEGTDRFEVRVTALADCPLIESNLLKLTKKVDKFDSMDTATIIVELSLPLSVTY